MNRRRFIQASGAASLATLGACLDLSPTPTDVFYAPRTIRPPEQLGGTDARVSISQWPNGADAAAMISVDDFCSVDLGDLFDFGGSWASNASSTTEHLLINEVLETFPNARVLLNTITASRFDPRSAYPLAVANPISAATGWCDAVRALQERHPGLSLGWHGWSHYNAQKRNAQEFLAYDARRTEAALDAMEVEGAGTGLRFDRGFRPPGWGITAQLLDELARRAYILLDNSQMSTFASFRPGYIATPSGRWLFSISTSFTLSTKQIFDSGGLVVHHHHMTLPSANSLTDPLQQQSVLNFLDAYYLSSAPQITWLAPSEVRAAYDLAANVDWEADIEGGRVTLSVRAPAQLAKGLTWHVTGDAVTDVVLEGGAGRLWTVLDSPGVLKLVVTN